MARRNIPSVSSLWEKHELMYSHIFNLALKELAEVTNLAVSEDAISEKLRIILTTVCFNLYRSENKEVRCPVWECPIQPISAEDARGGKVRKRPDFTCGLTNPFAGAAEEYEIPLHVECKRLGRTKKSWNLNKNYTSHGIARFDSKKYSYGKNASSGLMVGYLIDLDPPSVLIDVNRHQKKLCPKHPQIGFSFDLGKTFRAEQKIQRQSISPYRFTIIHLWVDLRNNCQN